MSAPRVRRALRRGALVCFGLTLGLAAAELAARRWSGVEGAWLLVNAPDLYDTSIFAPDAQLGQVLRPGAIGHMHTPEFSTEVRVSAQGTRGGDLAPKAAGAQRVLALGDSFTLAVQVPEGDSFSGRLSRALSETTGHPVEVVNAGVDGFGTFEATRQLQRLAPVVRPDVVLLTFFLGNDLEDNRRHRDTPAPVNAAALPSLASPLDTLFSWSFLYFHGKSLWRAQQAAADPGRSGRFRAEAEAFTRGTDLRERLAPTERALRELDSTAHSLGLPLVIALAPPAFVISPERAHATFELFGVTGEPDLQAPAREVSRRVPGGVSVVDLEPALEAAEGEGRTYFVFDGHWTARGHDTVARALTPVLLTALSGPRPASSSPPTGPPTPGTPR